MTSLNAAQTSNANTIIAVGRHLGASDRDIKIALMTALQESNLVNIGYGDQAGPDSRGLFQQRAPWGPLSARMDPAQSAAMFFQGGQGGQRGLFAFHNRDQMALTQAAQAVQVSAFPNAYAKWESLATNVLGGAGSGGGSASATGVGQNTVVAGRGGGSLNQTLASPGTASAAPLPVSTVTPTLPSTAAGPAPAGIGPGGPAGAASPTTPAGLDSPIAGPTTPAGLESVIGGPVADPAKIPTGPANVTAPVDAATFHSLFPDAAGTRMFSGGAQKATLGRRSDVVATAMTYLGTPFQWGGNSKQGLDCSGLTQQVYKAFGIDIPRVSSDQIRAGTPTLFKNLKPGDLIGWDNSPRNPGVDHVAIYAGNGRVIESPRPGINTRLRSLSQQEIDTGLGVSFGALG